MIDINPGVIFDPRTMIKTLLQWIKLLHRY